jgi:hypothetical protein
MKRLAWCILLGCLALAWAIARHAPPSPDVGAPADRVARAYDVGDLLDLPPDPAEPPPLVVPASRHTPPPPRNAAGTYGDREPTVEERRLRNLVTAIERGVDPNSWAVGRGTIATFGRRLIVVQTRANHDAVRTLLDDLRAFPPRQVRVDAIWARLTPAELDALSPPSAAPVRTVDVAALERVPLAISFRGQSTCLSGRRARVTSGRARAAVTEVTAYITVDRAGFEARAAQLLDGATVDVVPSLSPDGASVLLDVRSELVRFAPDTLPPIEVPAPRTPGGSTAESLRIDRLNLGVQAIHTSARGPTDAGIVMGETADPDQPPDSPKRLYLIVRAAEWKAAARK